LRFIDAVRIYLIASQSYNPTHHHPHHKPTPQTTMSTTPILLILGAGPNIGASLSRSFASKGYKIATTSRRGGPETNDTNNADHLSIKADLSDPSSVAGVYEKVREKWGVPSVVVYNGKYPTTSSFYQIDKPPPQKTTPTSKSETDISPSPRSRRRKPQQSRRPRLAPTGQVHAGSAHQHDIGLRRGARSSERFRATTL
jgi:NAD(P)-dependent dehydrogenase (short-subunit alcohol dehydrogenase family)